MRYQVPQFIEVEDKIFGPLTIKQFLYVAGGAAIAFMLWNLLPKFIAPFIAIPILIFAASLAFYRFNDQPFINAVENAVKYFFGNKLYVWKKQQKPVKKQEGVTSDTNQTLQIPKMSDSKLKDLSWSLDINENIED
jgi:hypothetical protein